jgi:hypothetical protein
MNEAHWLASGWVQRAAIRVGVMIDEPGHPTGHLVIPVGGHTMLKTIAAALLAASVLVVAPAMAAGPGRTTHAPVIKVFQAKPGVLNANARMGRHHHRHAHHNRFHKRFHNHR